jgi:hypothetical protein
MSFMGTSRITGGLDLQTRAALKERLLITGHPAIGLPEGTDETFHRKKRLMAAARISENS